MKFIRRETQERKLTIAGNDYPAIYSMQAIALMEEYTDMHHAYSEVRLSMDPPRPLAREVVGYAYGMIRAAGVEVEPVDVANSILPAEEEQLILQIRKIVDDQKAVPSKAKNAKSPETETTKS